MTMEAAMKVVQTPEAARRARRSKLARIAKELASISASLNDAETECAHCGAKRKVNWDETQEKEALNAAITRITNAVRKLDDPAKPGEGKA
jgi:hypothetical protein